MGIRRVSAFLATLVLLAACSSESVKDSDNPEIIYNAAVKFIERGRYLEATEHLNEIRHRFPQSRFAALAELRTGDLEFDQDNFTEAAAAYKVFVELYPNHPEAAYAQYRRAESYYKDTPDLAARDQTPAQDAVAAAQQVLTRYPKSEYAPKAQKILIEARHKLAEKEAYIARFYAKREEWTASRRRWEGLLKDFNDLKDDDATKPLFAEAQRQITELPTGD
jgi:outer membrane protein assembly factor BamD